jgi:hypothetical protein
VLICSTKPKRGGERCPAYGFHTYEQAKEFATRVAAAA